MDLTGYRSRSTPSLMAGVGEAKRRRSSGGGGRRHALLPSGVKVLLALGILALAWAGVRRAGRRSATDGTSGSSSGNAGHAVGSASGAADHQRSTAKQHASSHVGSGGAGVDSDADKKAEELARARTERAMRLLPSYRGNGKAETWPFFGNANRLLLATHGRLMWYRYDTDEVKVLQEGKGQHMFYGAFPGSERGILGEPTTLWVVAAPFDWQGKGTKEWLLHLDAESGRELARVQLPSRFTHDAVRRRDKVYVADTGAGQVLELAFPEMSKVRDLPLFTAKEHVNTLAPTAHGKLWALLHNLGNSQLVEVDLQSGRELRRLPGVGQKAHGLVMWQQAGALLLDSEGGALLLVDLGSGNVEKLWQVGEASKYLKGLCVVDDIAFFGIAPSMPRTRRADPTLNCELAAFDLQQRALLWRRQLPTRGLLNIVAAPHLTVESTSYAVNTRPLVSYRDKPEFVQAQEAARKWAMQQEREAQGAHAAQAAQQQAAQAAQHAQQEEQAAPQQTQQQAVAQQGQEAQHAQAAQQQAQQATQHTEHAQDARDAQAAQQQQHQEQAQQQHNAQQQAQALQAQQQEEQQQAQQRQNEQAQAQAQADQAQQQQQQQQTEQAQVQAEQAQRQEDGDAGQGAAPVVWQALSEAEQLPHADPLSRYPPRLDATRWSSGLPRLLMSAKNRQAGLSAGVQLRLFRHDTAPLKKELAALSEEDWKEEAQRASNAWIAGRSANLDAIKPGAEAIMLVFSSQDGSQVFRFPWYDRFSALLDPLLLKLLGPRDVRNLLRMQLALMPPHGEIKRHIDSGGYADNGHRIHLVVQSNPGVSFHVCDSMEHARAEGGQAEAASPPCVPLHVEEGLVFELNNRLTHYVENRGDQPRIHLVIDVAETPREQRQLRPGEVCHYAGNTIRCPEDAAGENAAAAAAGGGAAEDQHRDSDGLR